MIILAFLFATSGHADEISETQGIFDNVKAAFLDGNFKELDQIADEYRNGKTRTPSGLWKLTKFYNAIDILGYDPAGDEQSLYRLEEQVKKWIDEAPESKSAYIAYAILLSRHAFFIRGDGYAPSVPPERWPGYLKYLGKARRQLEASKAIASSDPHWYAAMLDVANGENWPEAKFDALLDEAATKEPYYYQSYFVAIRHKSPMWGGSLDAVRKVIEYAVAMTKPEDGIGFYARGYWYAMDEVLGARHFRGSTVDWPQINAGFEDLIKQYPDDWNINAWARFACVSLDASTTQKAFARLDGRIIPRQWKGDMVHGCQELASDDSQK
ncbi:DUF4034 domain-containing protein [Mesorhizobium sp. B2-1-8]|uniref:DUF4034 domain-containing protein n=1 Tax=Mesorhizobium sp. B2-1-8 TaxID=2589967 RepID=UPI001127B84A|nr:DUF4034 domain-containing protein [Mesorhizobium sp. B2-1-8]UCI20670.1 DUF4034 domain-containing protein [Mesorhizobium sp. B2-1-8]